jgi:hypothetical protein
VWSSTARARTDDLGRPLGPTVTLGPAGLWNVAPVLADAKGLHVLLSTSSGGVDQGKELRLRAVDRFGSSIGADQILVGGGSARPAVASGYQLVPYGAESLAAWIRPSPLRGLELDAIDF